MTEKGLRYTGTKIRETLHAQGRRQDWLAFQLGVSPATVNRWIKGGRSIDHTNAVKVAQILGVPFFLLFESPIGYLSDDDQIPAGRVA